MHLEQSDKSIWLTSSGLLSRLVGVFTVFLGLAGVLVAVAAADGFVWVWLFMVVWVVVSGFFAWMCLHYGVDITAVFDLAQRTVCIERRHLTGTATTIFPFVEIASVGLTRYPAAMGA
jgi:hypothetical protein